MIDSLAAWDEYKSTKNKVNFALRQAKAGYFRAKIPNEKEPETSLEDNQQFTRLFSLLYHCNASTTSPEEIAYLCSRYV